MSEGREGITVEAEDRIMLAVNKVGTKVDALSTKTGEFQLTTAIAIAKIQTIEASCPIAQVQDMMVSVKDTALEAKATAEAAKGESKRLAAIISAGITSIGAAIMAALGLHKN